MKEVQLSETDRAIIRACANTGPIDKMSIGTLKDLIKGEDKLELDKLEDGDIRNLSKAVLEFQLEDSQYTALSSCIDSGKPQLLKLIRREYVACYEHFHAAKDVVKE